MVVQALRLVEVEWLQLFKRVLGVVERVQRQRRMMFRQAMAVRISRFFLLQMGAVTQHDLAEVASTARAVDRATIAHSREYRQVAAVIQMRVRQDHSVQRADIDRQGAPVVQTQILRTLKQSAVDQDSQPCAFQQILRTGDGFRRTQKSQFHFEHLEFSSGRTRPGVPSLRRDLRRGVAECLREAPERVERTRDALIFLPADLAVEGHQHARLASERENPVEIVAGAGRIVWLTFGRGMESGV